MAFTLNDNQINTQQENETLYRFLDEGINDMEAGNELPLPEAFDKISELRNMMKNAKI